MMDPRINLVKANLRDLPPTTIVNALIDPLRSDGETLADAMRAAGDKVEQRTFPASLTNSSAWGQSCAARTTPTITPIERLTAAFAR